MSILAHVCPVSLFCQIKKNPWDKTDFGGWQKVTLWLLIILLRRDNKVVELIRAASVAFKMCCITCFHFGLIKVSDTIFSFFPVKIISCWRSCRFHDAAQSCRGISEQFSSSEISETSWDASCSCISSRFKSLIMRFKHWLKRTIGYIYCVWKVPHSF